MTTTLSLDAIPRNTISLTAFSLAALGPSVWEILWAPALRAQSRAQLSLEELYQRAGQVFRGEVLRETPERLEAGGGELAVNAYQIRVDESFKGEFQTLNGTRHGNAGRSRARHIRNQRLRRARDRA